MIAFHGQCVTDTQYVPSQFCTWSAIINSNWISLVLEICKINLTSFLSKSDDHTCITLQTWSQTMFWFPRSSFLSPPRNLRWITAKTTSTRNISIFLWVVLKKRPQKTLGFRFDGLQQRGILEIVRQTVDSNGGKAFIMWVLTDCENFTFLFCMHNLLKEEIRFQTFIITYANKYTWIWWKQEYTDEDEDRGSTLLYNRKSSDKDRYCTAQSPVFRC